MTVLEFKPRKKAVPKPDEPYDRLSAPGALTILQIGDKITFIDRDDDTVTMNLGVGKYPIANHQPAPPAA